MPNRTAKHRRGFRRRRGASGRSARSASRKAWPRRSSGRINFPKGFAQRADPQPYTTKSAAGRLERRERGGPQGEARQRRVLISNREGIMTTNAVSGSLAASLSSVLAAPSFTQKTDNDGDSDSRGGVPGVGAQSGGSTLFTALLAALTQFVTSHPAGTAAGAATTAATGTTTTPAATATTPASTTPAATTSTPASTTTAATTSTPAATTSTPASTTTPAGATTPATPSTPAGTTTSGTAGAVPSTLPQDLHAFLHDLFRALRQEGHARHGDDDSRHSRVPSAPVSTTPVSSAPVTAEPVSTPVTATGTGTVTTPATNTATSSPVAAPNGIAQYGQRGLVAELTALIRDLNGGSTASAGAAGTPSRVSTHTLADLNTAFGKLIGDLGGTVAGATAGTATTTATAAASHPDTSALQSFLASFLQDLQGSAVSAAGKLGNGVNVTA
jgi:hypothetical protein